MTPNPVSNIINANLESAFDCTANYSIATVDGQIVQEGILQIQKGSNKLTINLENKFSNGS